VYIPRYIGDILKAIIAINPQAGEDVMMLEEEKD
jgi:hypothetical protein